MVPAQGARERGEATGLDVPFDGGRTGRITEGPDERDHMTIRSSRTVRAISAWPTRWARSGRDRDPEAPSDG